jgi:uncharacterized protein YegP (UPF0339 family)
MSAEPTYKFELFSRKRRNKPDRVYYFRVIEENGQTVLPSQGYSRAIDRTKVAFNLRDGLVGARFYDLDHGGMEVE